MTGTYGLQYYITIERLMGRCNTCSAGWNE